MAVLSGVSGLYPGQWATVNTSNSTASITYSTFSGNIRRKSPPPEKTELEKLSGSVSAVCKRGRKELARIL